MNIEITDKMLEDFYNCFDKKKGTDFEVFLKIFLTDLGFEEVEKTGKPGDNGVDLECFKYIIEDNNKLAEKYIVQAKKYELSNHISPKQIRDLQGNEKANHRIFITTSSFSRNCIDIASEENTTRPVILISGKDILEYYIAHPEKDVLFNWKAEISKKRIKELIEQEMSKEPEQEQMDNEEENNQKPLDKSISRNDIRARILPIPNEIFKIVQNYDSFEIEAFDEKKSYNINKERRFFSGITELYRKAGYIGYSGDEKKKSFWKMSKDKKYIILELE